MAGALLLGKFFLNRLLLRTMARVTELDAAMAVRGSAKHGMNFVNETPWTAAWW